MLDKLSTETRGKVEPFVNRMETFASKIQSRVQEIKEEADAGLNELIQVNALDSNAIASGFNAVKSRIQGLGDKIQGAEEKLEEEWEEAVEDLDLEGEEQQAVSVLWAGIVNKSRELQHKLEQWAEEIEAKKQADWARLVYKMAEQECQKERQCPSCGAGIQVEIQHAHSAIRCPHCDSVNEIDIGMATGLYYQGLGIHALSHEAAFNDWIAQHNAELTFNAWRHPTDDDRKAYLDAAHTYWTHYYQTTLKLHPGFNRTLEEAVDAKMSHFTAYDNAHDQKERAFYGKLIRAAQAGDQAALRELMQGTEDVEDCAVAIHERGNRQGAIAALKIQYELEDEDEDQNEWLQEKLTELDERLATR